MIFIISIRQNNRKTNNYINKIAATVGVE